GSRPSMSGGINAKVNTTAAQALVVFLVFGGLALREAVVDRLASLGERTDPAEADAPERW
ncbi:MAG: hypothetical protein ABEH78_10880, partial [Haloferacaceae archaeon]